MIPPSRSQVAVITGGGGGLATVCKDTLKREGMEVIAPTHKQLPVENKQCVIHFFQDIPQVDLLICSAGSTKDKPLAFLQDEDWEGLLSSHAKGSLFCAQAACQKMKKQGGGSIIFITSFASFHPSRGQLAYATAKSILNGLCHDLAKEWGKYNIRVNAIAPGFLETAMTQQLSKEHKKSYLLQHTLQRLNTPEHVALFIAFLHERLPHTSGQLFSLDSRII